MTGYLLAVDLGTSSVKALVSTAEGDILGRGEASYPIDVPFAGMAEQDPGAWWKSTVKAARAALSGHPDAGVGIACVGLTGQMHGTVLLGRDGWPLAPAVIWPDQRSKRQVQEITAIVGPQELIRLTGSPAATGFPAATIRWFQEHRPEVWDQVHQIVLPKDYLQRRLTGQFRTDPSDASATNLYDLRQGMWSKEILAALGIDEGRLPQVLPSDAIVGGITREAAEELGITPEAAVVTGAGDVACGMLGAGIAGEEEILLSISTGGQLAGLSAESDVDLKGRVHTFCSAYGQDGKGIRYLHLGAILAAGLSLRWLRDDVLRVGEKLPYSQLTSWAAEAPAGSDGLLFLPYIAGERTPHMDPSAKGAFIGLTLRHNRSHLIRAVLEGVAMACYDAYLVLKELGAKPNRIIMAGGGARSFLWRQIICDIFGLEVVSPLVPEQSAYGAAMLAASGSGFLRLTEAATRWTRYDSPVKPDFKRHRLYQEQFMIYREVYRSAQR